MRTEYGPQMLKASKTLAKKYASFYQNLQLLEASLLVNPQQGNALGQSCYKVRVAITSKGKGKSGGARVITCVKVLQDRIVLLTIYDKSDKEDLESGELETLLAEAGLT